ncbi:MAG: hypothetical protein J6T32_01320 [Paludibacteraceae bacterium]|nr:hypothetical protein [Paludibacteraceae bacterium]MBR6354709.1 hypothetical protein [Paludibacteraceae bacterium]
MNSFLKVLGLIFILLGVCCLVVYATAMPDNWLLVASLVLEVIGILAYILLNKIAK